MDFGLDDKTALVTGGGGRIGSEDCEVLGAEGATVVALDVNLEAAQTAIDTVEEQGGEVLEHIAIPPTDGAISEPTRVAAMSVWLIGSPQVSDSQSGMADTCRLTRAWIIRTRTVDR